jgi:hypothetical protein
MRVLDENLHYYLGLAKTILVGGRSTIRRIKFFVTIQLEDACMCYEIDSMVVLAKRLCSGRQDSVTLGELKKLRIKIESKVRSVVVDMSEESVFSAIEFHPELFRWNGDAIAKAADSDRFLNTGYLYACFNNRVPTGIRSQVLKAIAD